MDILYYINNNRLQETGYFSLDNGYTCNIWKPTLATIVPSGITLFPFGFWWVLHQGRIFANPNYAILLIRFLEKLVHRSTIIPGYFRFPFMKREDLQIGDTWTSEDHRGKGLAVYAIKKIVSELSHKDRRIWYITDKGNLPSIRAAEKAGLVRYGEGVRKKKYGTELFGYYRISKIL